MRLSATALVIHGEAFIKLIGFWKKGVDGGLEMGKELEYWRWGGRRTDGFLVRMASNFGQP